MAHRYFDGPSLYLSYMELRMSLVSIVKAFIKEFGLAESRLLVAVSGGPDSIALMHSLVKCKESYPFLRLGVAHVDHGWREESHEEALQLEKIVRSLNLEWHLKILNPESMQGNLEEASRNERYDFFLKLTQDFSYDGVVLGHHADDQAETVLKRLLEGASLFSCKAMAVFSQKQGLNIYRPFLSLNKKEILSWLSQKNLSYFSDITNSNPIYTRARMRSELIPHLSNIFKKEISNPLCNISRDLDHLEDYLEEKLKCYYMDFIKGWAGWKWEIPQKTNFHSFEIKYLLHRFLKISGFFLSRQQIEDSSQMLQNGAANKVFKTSQGDVWLDRRRIFIKINDQIETQAPISISPGIFHWGGWTVEIKESDKADSMLTGLENAWLGRLKVSVPPGNYWLGKGQNSHFYTAASKTLGKWWTEKKIPAFLRNIVPIIGIEENVLVEFFNHKSIPLEKRAVWNVTLIK